MGRGVLADFLKNGWPERWPAPIPIARGAGGIKDHPWDIEWAGLALGLDGMRAEVLGAPAAKLGEGHGIIHSPGEVLHAWNRAGGISHLADEEGNDIARMEAIADLVPGAVEADVFERAAAGPGVDPVAEDALVGLAELAGAGEDSAAIDANGEIEGEAVFEGEQARSSASSFRRGRGAARSRNPRKYRRAEMPGMREPMSGTRASSRTVTGRAARGGIEYTRLVLRRMKPAAWARQYSRRLMVPRRL